MVSLTGSSEEVGEFFPFIHVWLAMVVNKVVQNSRLEMAFVDTKYTCIFFSSLFVKLMKMSMSLFIYFSFVLKNSLPKTPLSNLTSFFFSILNRIIWSCILEIRIREYFTQNIIWKKKENWDISFSDIIICIFRQILEGIH